MRNQRIDDVGLTGLSEGLMGLPSLKNLHMNFEG